MKKNIAKLFIFFIFLLYPSGKVEAALFDVGNHMTIDIPEGYQETYSDSCTYCWQDATSTLTLKIYNDKDFDETQCLKSLDGLLFNLSSYIQYEERHESALEWHKEYAMRFYYHVQTKKRLITYTAYTNERAYSIGFTYNSDTDIEKLDAITSSIRYEGSWWKRMKLLLAQSWGMSILAAFLLSLCVYFFPGVSKSLTATLIFCLLFGMGYSLWQEWSTGIFIYAYWGILLWLTTVLSIDEYNQFSKSITDNIK